MARRDVEGGPIFSHALWAVHDLDSGALSIKAVVAHPVAATGRHYGAVMVGERLAAGFALECGGAAEAQATADLAQLHRRGRAAAPNEVVAQARVQAGGYLVLHVGHGDGGYHVLLTAPAGARRAPWDSRELESGDIVSLMPLRPGAYTLRNTAGEDPTSARVVVTYPDPRGNTRETPRPRPVYTSVRPQGFDAPRFEVRPAQGIVIAVACRARLVLALEQPDDGSEEFRRWREQERARLLRAARPTDGPNGPAAS